ncbi:MAG: uroporphyrinogen decarboxylase family protein [Aeromicrobium sp.]
MTELDSGAMKGRGGSAAYFMNDANRLRFARATERVDAAFRHVDTDDPPIVIQDANYSITGEEPETIPDDYFAEGAFGTMTDYQTRKIVAHLERYTDDYVPFLFPWYGTVVVPSALGCQIHFGPKAEPAVEGPIIAVPADVSRLVPPDPYRDGLMPRVLRCIDYMRANSDLPVSFTDCQGPLNIALNLVGVETICLWMYDYPSVVHELMDFCTTVLIDWVNVQKRHAGQELDGGAFPHFTILPKGQGGVWISDDDSTILSPELYRRFVVPYNARVFQAFGGGTLHYCGNGRHQLENLAATEGLMGVSVWCMGDFEQVFRAQELFEDRITVMVSDFSPLDIEGYFGELLAGLRLKGTVIQSCPSPVVATVKGRSETHHRDSATVGHEALQAIQANIKRRIRSRSGSVLP